MKKTIFAAVAALTFTVGSAAFAQSAPTTPAPAPTAGAKTGTPTESGKTDAKKDSKTGKKPAPAAEKTETAK